MYPLSLSSLYIFVSIVFFTFVFIVCHAFDVIFLTYIIIITIKKALDCSRSSSPERVKKT